MLTLHSTNVFYPRTVMTVDFHQSPFCFNSSQNILISVGVKLRVFCAVIQKFHFCFCGARSVLILQGPYFNTIQYCGYC